MPLPADGSWTEVSVSVTVSGAPEAVAAARVTGTYFSSSEVAPMLGRLFLDEEYLPDGAAAVVLTDDFWRERLGGQPSAIGSTVVIDGITTRVVGVMPPGFSYPEGTRMLLPRVGS